MFAYPHTTLSKEPKHCKDDNSSVTVLTALTTAVVSTYMLWLYPVARAYGLRGLLRYLRDGDPHPPDVRKGKQTLKSIAVTLDDKEKALADMEVRIRRPSLYSLDGAVLRISRKDWERDFPDHDNLRKNLSLLGRELDQLAAQIDQVISTVETKGLKKELSDRVEKMMARTDALISFYKLT